MDHQAIIKTPYGPFEVSELSYEGQTAVIVKSNILQPIPFLRIHSSCVFSESLNAIDCDCSLQLDASLAYIGINGGLVIYLYQEGRGIGLNKKIQAIALQQKLGIDTASAFQKLGHDPDPRTYPVVIEILKRLNINEVYLATRNPLKIKTLEEAGIKINKIIELEIPKSELVELYISEKSKALGHSDVHDVD